jgi:hypothetical protein
MKGDLAGELFQPNSRQAQAAAEGSRPFGEDDQPLYDADRRPVDEGHSARGNRIPGYLVERPSGSRADVTAMSWHRGGEWVVVLQRTLHSGNTHDVAFVPGDPRGVAFGLAVMDHTLFEHYASTLTERLVLLDKLQAAQLLPQD